MRTVRITSVAIVMACVALTVSAQPAKVQVPGVTNFNRIDAAVACAGAVTPAAVAEVKKLGYRTIINLRQPGEPGADVEAEGAAAQAAGIRYINIPFDHSAPDPAAVDRFLTLIADPNIAPVLLHCASGSRAATFWMIKRIMLDEWTPERAEAEAVTIGLKNPDLKAFALKYVHDHGR